MSNVLAKENKPGHRLTIYLPNALYYRFKREAQEQKTTIGKVVRQHLATEEKNLSVFDLMGDLIGSVSSGIGDLSTNPKHMKGFGQDIKRAKLAK